MLYLIKTTRGNEMKLQKHHEENGTKFYSLYAFNETYSFLKNNDGYWLNIDEVCTVFGDTVVKRGSELRQLEGKTLKEVKREIASMIYRGEV